MQTGDVTLVSIEDCVPVDCEHARSESWSLSARDRYILESTLRQLGKRRKGNPAIVGWFRTHTRRGLYLDQYDFNLFREYFANPSAVALLIRPEDPLPTAAFFFWEGGELQRSQPHDAFPFSVESLRPRSVAPAPVPEPVKAAPEPKRQNPPVIERPRPASSHVRPRLPLSDRVSPVSGGRSILRVPSLPRLASLRSVNWRKAAFVAPVLAGIAFGVFWNPTPLQRTRREELSRNRGVEPQERAVFTPSAVPPAETAGPVFTPPPEQGAEVPKPLPPPPPKVLKTLQVPRRQARLKEPVLDVQAPAISAVARFDVLPSPKVQHLPRAIVTVEPYKAGVLRRTVGSIPGLGFLKRKKQSSGEEFVPARVLTEFRPVSPASLTQEVEVNVKLTVSPNGDVERAELVTKRVDVAIAQAAVDAARRWRFHPATLDEKPVASEMLLQFRFGTPDSDGT